MTTPSLSRLLEDVRRQGFSLRAEGGNLVLSGPRGAMGPELRERLAGAKEELLAHLAAGVPAGPEAVERDGPAPLGPVQRRMWMMDRLDPGSTLLNLAGAWKLTGEFRREAFEACLREVVDRHEVLRTRLVETDGEVLQEVVEPEWDLPLEDLSHLPEASRHEEMVERIGTVVEETFDLSRAPLFRSRLYRLDPREHVFLFVPHHVIWDGWCWDVLHAELEALYPAFVAGRPSPLPPLPFQYGDFAVWHDRLMQGPELHRQLDFWRRELEGGLEPLRFPGADPDEAGRMGADAGHRRVLEWDPEVLERLRSVAREEGATLFMALLSAWAVLLHRATGQTGFGIGIPVQDRLHPGTEALLGAMVNTVVIVAEIQENATFRSVLRSVRDRCLAAYEHQDLPFEELVRAVQGGDGRRAPLFQSLFSYQDVRNRPLRLGDLKVSQVHLEAGVTETDVGCGFMVSEERTVALLDFRARVFDAAAATRLGGGFRALVEDASARPDRPVDRLLISHDEALPRVPLLMGEDLPGPSGDTGRHPLTPHQRGIWLQEQLTGGSPVHHLVERIRIRGPLDAGRLARAWGEVVARHDALRLRVSSEHGSPFGEAAERGPGLELLETGDTAGALEALDDRARSPFLLDEEVPVRATLAPAGRDEAVLQVVAHNLVADEGSLARVLREIGARYAGSGPDDDDDAPSFLEHAATVRARVDRERRRVEMAWWLDRIPEEVPPLALPLDRPREAAASRPAGSLPLLDDPAVREAVTALAGEGALPEEAVVLSAWWLALARRAARDDFLLGLVVPRREGGPAEDRIVGPLQNTVVASLGAAPDDSFAQLCRETARRLGDLLDHADVPFEDVVAEANPVRTTAANPFFMAQVTLTAHPAADLPVDGVETLRLPSVRAAIQVDLSLALNRDPDHGWDGRLDFAADVFEADTARALVEDLHRILRTAVERPSVRVSELRTASPAELQELEDRATGSLTSVPDSLLQGIEEAARAHPGRVAVRTTRAELTYGELWERSGRVARGLVQRGVGTRSVVGVCFERDPSLLVALLGVWRAGAAYLPLDPDFPEDRLAFMVADADAALVLHDGRARLPATDAPATTLDGVEGADDARPLPEVASDAWAYLIYTSGSTGRPKGVEVTHGNLANFVQSMSRTPGFGEEDVLLAVTTLSFDIAGLELWLPLWVGGRVELADEEEVVDGEWLAERLEDGGATVMQATPSTWRMLLEAGWEGRLHRALCGGEAFPRELVRPLLERADEVWNLYGPTETTVWSTAHRVRAEPEGSVPIGRPIENTWTWVMTPDGEPTPPGVPGELWIGGLGVARGYHARPEQTAQRFPADPFRGEGAIYRTGDLVRWRGDGVLEHLGRMDDQVKVHGHRIELGEVEAALADLPRVRQAAVKVSGEAAEARLVGYVVPEGPGAVLGSELRRDLAERLPQYMVPGLITEVEALPLTPNGKVDRRALPDPLHTTTVRSFEPPRTERERLVASVWSTLLENDRIGVYDNFFELGGHSLSAIRAVALLAERHGLRVDPRSLFFMTLEQVAASASEEERVLTGLS